MSFPTEEQLKEAGLKMQTMTGSEFYSLPSRHPDRAFVTGEMSRPGYVPFTVKVEYTMYEPGTAANAKLDYLLTKFPKGEEFIWSTMMFPLEDLEKVRLLAAEFEMHFGPTGTCPHAFSPEGVQVFPLELGPNVFFMQGHMKDELKVKQLHDYWNNVIDKCSQGLPWKE